MPNHAIARRRIAAGIVFAGCYFAAISCTDSKEKDKSVLQPSDSWPKQTVKMEEGKAGGEIEQTYNANATIRAIDAKTRKVTLQTESGQSASFTAPPEVRIQESP